MKTDTCTVLNLRYDVHDVPWLIAAGDDLSNLDRRGFPCFGARVDFVYTNGARRDLPPCLAAYVRGIREQPLASTRKEWSPDRRQLRVYRSRHRASIDQQRDDGRRPRPVVGVSRRAYANLAGSRSNAAIAIASGA